MRTPLDIAEDALFAAKDFTQRNQDPLNEAEVDRRFHAMGFAPFKHPQGQVVTNDMVNALREQEGI